MPERAKKTSGRRRRFAGLMALGLLSAGMTTVLTATEAPSQGSAEKFEAVYRVKFSGMTLGDFKVFTNVTPDRYAVWGNGKLTFLTGLIFEIKGRSAATGRISPNGPGPEAFSFAFSTKNGNGNMAMKFENGAVAQVSAQPPFRIRDNEVRVTESHVKGVMDPLSALFYSTVSRSGEKARPACSHRIPVYDGKYRFDIQLSHKKAVKVARKGKSGYQGIAVICKAKFVPVAGHRPGGKNVTFFTETEEIEAWLIPLPHRNAFVPYLVKIPTPYGEAQITAREFHIETPSRKQIALVR